MTHNPRIAKAFIALITAAWIGCIIHGLSRD